VYKEGLTVAPKDVLLNRMTANLYVNLDSIAQAIPYAAAVVELSPMDKEAARRLGSIYFAADSMAQADSIFSALVDMSDFHPVNYYYLGRIAVADENFERARDNFMRLTQVADTLVDSWLDLAFAYRRLNQTENEVTTYKTGLNHMRDEASAIRLLFALGAAYERTDRVEEAIEVFEELIAQVPDNAEALNFLGYMLADRGERLEYAKDLIERALQVSPENAAFLDSYGWVAYRLGSFQEAVEYLNRAVVLDNDPVIFDHLGDAYRATGDIEQAQKWWRKALELSPDDEKIKEKLGH
jgi:tetratricopeptide (TPR) repeat protein